MCRYFFAKNKNKPISQYIKNVLGFRPKNIDLYDMACTHRSASGKSIVCGPINNERLEYLGDAVLSAIIADYLFKKYPTHAEGPLTEMRSKIVNRDRLNKLSQKIGLHTLIQIDAHTYAKSAGGDALEALIGAIYLDQGYNKTKKIVLKKIILTHLDIDSIFLEDNNYKSKILSWGQKEHKRIEFKHSEILNGNSKKLYKAELYIDEELFGEGFGYTIKNGEQEAAEKAWLKCNESS